MEYYKNLQLEDIQYIDDDGISKIEEWKDIPGYEGIYRMSDLGRVKSLSRERSNGFGLYTIPDRILRQSNADYNSLSCSLCKDNKQIKFKIHTLLAMAFLNHTPCGMKRVVDHVKQNRKDNRLTMLKVTSQRENTNQKHLPSSSKFTGVYFHGTHKKWCSAIRILKEKIHLGAFEKEEDAAEAYNVALYNWENHKTKPEKKKFGSIYKGVTYFKARDKWVAKIKLNGKLTHIGIFKTELEANYAFQEALLKNPNATA
jgi:hypothetical protein